MDINNVNSQKINSPSNFDHNQIVDYSKLKTEMNNLEKKFQFVMAEYQKNPKENLDKLLHFMHEMKAFLIDHKEEIFAAGKQNGWPIEMSNGEASYPYTYKSMMENINTFLNPANGYQQGGLDYINEQITQLNFFLSNGIIK